jgi:hypothetical protein
MRKPSGLGDILFWKKSGGREELALQKEPTALQVTLDGARRKRKVESYLLDRQTAEVVHLEDFPLPFIEGAELLQCLVESEQVFRLLRRKREIVWYLSPQVSAALFGILAPGMIYQNLANDARGKGKKLTAILVRER